VSSRLEEQYLDKVNLNCPIQWLIGVIARLMLSKLWLVVRLDDPPLLSDKGTIQTSTTRESPTVPKNNEIFRMAIETLKFANLMQTNSPTA
jgi:hypothetical protein